MDGITAVLDISTLIYNGAAAENRNTTYIAKGGKLSHNTAALKVMSGDTYSTAPTSYFYIDDYIDQNARADKTGAQILNDDMFQFSTQTDGTVKAVEVSGAGTAAAYKNLHSENLAIYKDTQITSGLVANSNTVYLIRSGDDTTASPYTFKSVTGFDKIDRYQNDEVDYVMSDDFAKYVFIKADPTESKVTSVFFYAGEQASFNNETGVWTTPGYLDGEKTAIYAVGWNNSNVNTIIDTATGRGNANTIYSVALSNGYLDKDYTSAWVYTSTDPIRAASVNGVTYPLAAAYMNRNDVKPSWQTANRLLPRPTPPAYPPSAQTLPPRAWLFHTPCGGRRTYRVDNAASTFFVPRPLFQHEAAKVPASRHPQYTYRRPAARWRENL